MGAPLPSFCRPASGQLCAWAPLAITACSRVLGLEEAEGRRSAESQSVARMQKRAAAETGYREGAQRPGQESPARVEPGAGRRCLGKSRGPALRRDLWGGASRPGSSRSSPPRAARNPGSGFTDGGCTDGQTAAQRSTEHRVSTGP